MRIKSMMFLVGVLVGGVGLGWLGLETPRGATTELSGADYAEIELSLIHISEPTRPY